MNDESFEQRLRSFQLTRPRRISRRRMLLHDRRVRPAAIAAVLVIAVAAGTWRIVKHPASTNAPVVSSARSQRFPEPPRGSQAALRAALNSPNPDAQLNELSRHTLPNVDSNSSTLHVLAGE